MAISKIILNNASQIDLTSDTVTADKLLQGYTAHDASGTQITGTATAGGNLDIPIFTQVFSNDWETRISITCNKTVSECFEYYNACLITKNQDESEEYVGFLVRTVMGTMSVTYTFSSNLAPYMDIQYTSNGITIIEPSERLETLNITQNGTYYPSGLSYIEEVNVSVPSTTPSLQSKSATPTESQQTVTADSGYDGLSSVTVGAISSTYVGSGIDRNDSSDLTVSGATVTVPSGYYESQVSKTVASGTAGTPTATKGTVSNHSISVTPSVTNTTGYITGSTKTGTAVTVTASELASGNKSISANGTGIDVVGYSTVSVDVEPNLQAKTNISPTTSSQTITADSNYDGLSSVQINAMPSGSASTPATTITANPTISVSSGGLITATASASQNVTPSVSAGYVSSGTAGTITVSGSKTQQLTTKGATTITPTKSSQTAVASGVYTTGAITVDAIPANYITTSDATATASDIVGGETAYVNGSKVTGSLIVQTYRTGTSAPSSSLGVNGDIYLRTS